MSATASPAKAARIDALLRVVLEKKASDLHVACGSPPMIRIDGDLSHLQREVERLHAFYLTLRGGRA